MKYDSFDFLGKTGDEQAICVDDAVKICDTSVSSLEKSSVLMSYSKTNHNSLDYSMRNAKFVLWPLNRK